MGRQFGSFRANVSLQAFAHGTANRAASGAIDLFAALIGSVGHRGSASRSFRLIDIGPSHPGGNCFVR
jgi:hypothetical protein